MRVCWLTDIHLNFLPQGAAAGFLRLVRDLSPEAVLLGGDIGEAHDVVGYLQLIDEVLAVPVYFVLGNHDFYYGSIPAVRLAVENCCRARPRLVYLSACGVVELSRGIGLVGHDGWADGRLGNYEQSLVAMNDYKLIDELAHLTKQERWGRLKALGDQAGEHMARVLPEALAKYEQVVVLTHVPPLREACWHQGQISDDHWAPHFTCKAVGDVLVRAMRERPDRRMTVLCGHTHGEGETWPLPNLRILTGGAVYGTPQIQRVLELV